MASSTVAALEAGLRRRGVPTTFCRWSFSTYTVADLRDILTVLSSTAPSGTLKLDLCIQLHNLRPGLSSFSTAEWDAIRAIKRARSAARGKGRPKAKAPESRTQANSVVSSDIRKGTSPTSIAAKGKVNLAKKVTVASDVEDSTEIATTQTSRATSPERVLCSVCLEEIIPTSQMVGPITSTCLHEQSPICRGCLEEHITHQSTSVELDRISCPINDCQAVLGYNDMHRFAPTELFARYDQYLNQRALGELPGYQHCANPGCTDGGFVDQNDTFMTCATCNVMTCISCSTIFHPGMTHAENQKAIRQSQANTERAKEKKREESKSTKAIEKLGAKLCPGEGCGVLIQKRGGCDHMTCRRCGHDFCYVCLADYGRIRRYGNHQHTGGCRYYSPLQAPAWLPALTGRRR